MQTVNQQSGGLKPDPPVPFLQCHAPAITAGTPQPATTCMRDLHRHGHLAGPSVPRTTRGASGCPPQALPHFTSAKKPPRLLPTLPRPHTVGGSSVAPRYKASHLPPEPWTRASATRLLQGTQWTQEPRMAADPGTGTQRAVGTVRRQAALPCQGDGLPLPTGLRHGQPGRGRPTLLIFQQEDKWKYRVLVNLLRVWTLV